MEKYSLTEVVEEAVRTERLGYEFYTAMSAKFKNDGKLRELFDTLAQKELTHEKRFAGLREKISEEEPAGWDEVSEYLRAIVESEFFLGKGKSLPSLEHVKTPAEAVRFALSFEKETLLYFHALRDFVGGSSVLDEIIAEERSHIVWLSTSGLEPQK